MKSLTLSLIKWIEFQNFNSSLKWPNFSFKESFSYLIKMIQQKDPFNKSGNFHFMNATTDIDRKRVEFSIFNTWSCLSIVNNSCSDRSNLYHCFNLCRLSCRTIFFLFTSQFLEGLLPPSSLGGAGSWLNLKGA
jgi:hypothetical protein